MHQIIKQRGPNRQLFIKITFAFMKIFDFLVKIAIFGAFVFRSKNLRQEYLDRKTNAPKMVILTRKSKIFIKAKVIFMKSCLLGQVRFMI